VWINPHFRLPLSPVCSFAVNKIFAIIDLRQLSKVALFKRNIREE